MALNFCRFQRGHLGKPEVKKSKEYFGLLNQGKGFLEIALHLYKQSGLAPTSKDLIEVQEALETIQTELKKAIAKDYPGTMAPR